MSDKIVLLDGHSILNRAFYGVPDLSKCRRTAHERRIWIPEYSV